jgi:hypothetical protein
VTAPLPPRPDTHTHSSLPKSLCCALTLVALPRWMMRAIWARRDAIVLLQAALRARFAGQEYSLAVAAARAAAAQAALEARSGFALSLAARRALAHTDMHLFARALNALRRAARARADAEAWARAICAARCLAAHARAAAAQSGGSLALPLPLKRFARLERRAGDAAQRLQAHCRAWCCMTLGLPSRVDFVVARGGAVLPAVHLAFEQQRQAGCLLQASARRLCAASDDARLQPRGYAAQLAATAVLHGFARALAVRTLGASLMDMYGVSALQAAPLPSPLPPVLTGHVSSLLAY